MNDNKIIIYIFCVLYIVAIPINSLLAQVNLVDSLKKELQREVKYPDSVTVDMLIVLSQQYVQNKPDSAIIYIKKALNISRNINYLAGEASAFHSWGNLAYYQGKYDSSFLFFEESLSIRRSRGDDKGMAKTLKNIAGLFRKAGDIKKAKPYALEALALAKKSKDHLLIGRIMNNIGTIYSDYDDQISLDSSIYYFTKALEIYQENDLKEGTSIALNNLGWMYKKMGLEDKALEYFEEALLIDRELQTDHFGMCITMQNIASYYITNELYTKSEKYLLESLEIAEAKGFEEVKADTYSIFVDLNQKKGNYKEAFEFLEKERDLRLELLKIKQNELVEDLHAKYETSLKQQEIASLNQLTQIQNLELDKKSQNLYLLFLLLIFISFLSIFIFIANRQKNQLLKHKAQDMEQKLLRTQMNPHFIFNSLTAIQDYMLQGNAEKASSYLTKFSKLIRQVLDNSRSDFIAISDEIVMLENYLSLQNLRRDIPFTYSIEVDNRIHYDDTIIPPMFVQPFIENAIEHGFKKVKENAKITVRFHLHDNQLKIEVEDNGNGYESIEKTDLPVRKSHAIKITKERIELFKQMLRKEISFELSPKENVGSRVTLFLPFEITGNDY